MTNQQAKNIVDAREQITTAMWEALFNGWPLTYLDENMKEFKL